ncbi:MAG: hypothetical protein AAB445_01020 [Patescibacteria group bacterium]
MPKAKQRRKAAHLQTTHAPTKNGLGLQAQAFLHSLGVVVYISFVSFLMFNVERIFGGQPDTFLAPVAFLLLFTLSAAIVGLLVFGRPIMLYLDGKKREAVEFAATTVGFLFIEAILVFTVLALASL